MENGEKKAMEINTEYFTIKCEKEEAELYKKKEQK